VLDAAGRTPAEIWLTGGSLYKFILKSSVGVQIGSYDNIPAIGDVTSINTLITVAGTNTLTGLATPSLAGYVAGAQYSFIAQNNNTAAVTIDIDTLGAKSITKVGSVALEAGDIVAGALYQIAYDGTRFQLLTRTSASQLVVGTTAQRPATPSNGAMRWNSELLVAEIYNGINWQAVASQSYSVNYLVEAGGGGGGSANSGGAGGGGAGGLLSSSLTVNSGTAYTVTIGSGGAAGATQPSNGTNGSNSVFSSATATGGGGGAGANTGSLPANSGGCGGGGGFVSGAPGSGTSGQGFAGGAANGGSGASGGGGGGTSAVGGTGTATPTAGVGGAGLSSSISGSSVNYGGGGGGGNSSGPAAAGGAGGGGAGQAVGVSAAVAGSVNTGGGGGGGYGSGSSLGAAGGSGTVIVSYLASAQRGTGGTVTSYGAGAGLTWVHTFNSSGTYTA